MGSTMRRFAVALAATGLLVAVGCSKEETVTASSTTAPVTASSGGGSGTTEPDDTSDTTDPDSDKGSGEYAESCEAIEELEALDEENGDDADQTFALMEQARDAGPDDLVDHWDTLIGVLEELEALGDSDEAFTRAFELYEDPEFIAAAGAIDDFAEEECGIDIDLDPTEEDSPGGLSEDPTDTTDPDEDPTSIDALQSHLQSEFGTERWYDVLDGNVSWTSSGTPSKVTWTVAFGDDPIAEGMTIDDLVDVCDAMADYLDTHEGTDVEIDITGPGDAELVTRAPGESCQAA